MLIRLHFITSIFRKMFGANISKIEIACHSEYYNLAWKEFLGHSTLENVIIVHAAVEHRMKNLREKWKNLTVQ